MQPSQDQPASPVPGKLTLERLVSSLGTHVLRPVTAPRGLDLRLGDLLTHDEVTRAGAGDLVLLVGCSPAGEEAARAVADAGRREAAAVIVKSRGPVPDGLLAVAREAAVAVLTVSDKASWAQLVGLLRSVLVTGGETASGTAIAQVPLGDLFGLANAIASMVGGAVTIEDPQSRVLAYSSVDMRVDEARRQAILEQHVPADQVSELQELGVFRRLWNSDDVVAIDARPQSNVSRRFAIAIRAGDEILGSIWVAEAGAPLPAHAPDALRGAARLVPLHLIRHRAAGDLERRLRDDLAHQLLDREPSAEVAAARLQFDPDLPAAVVAFETRATATRDPALLRERLADLVGLHCAAYRREALPTVLGRRVYVVLPELTGDTPARLRQLAEDIAARARTSLGSDVFGAIGACVPKLWEVPSSRAEVDQVMRILARNGSGTVVATLDDVRSEAILQELLDVVSSRPHLQAGKVHTLVVHDREHGTRYAATLRAYLEAFGNLPAAARATGLHPNTFRYRLQRLTELVGLRLDDPAERLVAAVQLHLHER
ncbi:MAG TPA: helix-turn-helix domain-containing protein [Amycolatopsis sp.]|nr:helix-turn-helix domain-containing protein [Amycolatopsis sp.]